jgi:hypothetical protein
MKKSLVLLVFLAQTLIAGGNMARDPGWAQSVQIFLAESLHARSHSRCSPQAQSKSSIPSVALHESDRDSSWKTIACKNSCTDDQDSLSCAAMMDRSRLRCSRAVNQRWNTQYELGSSDPISKCYRMQSLCGEECCIPHRQGHKRAPSMRLRGGEASEQGSIEELKTSDVNMKRFSASTDQRKEVLNDLGGISPTVSGKNGKGNSALGESLPEPLSSQTKGGAEGSVMDTDSERVRSRLDGERGPKDTRSETSISHTEETTTIVESDGSRQGDQTKKYRHPTKNAKRDMIREKLMQAFKKHEKVCISLPLSLSLTHSASLPNAHTHTLNHSLFPTLPLSVSLHICFPSFLSSPHLVTYVYCPSCI